MARKEKADPKVKVLELLKNVLPKAVPDPKLVDKIFSACEREISTVGRVESFEKFCERVELLDLEAGSVLDVKRQFEESFGRGAVAVTPMPEENAAKVKVEMNGQVLEGRIKVGVNGELEEEKEEEFKPKFVPFPVALETDPELVWVLGRGENLTPEEAGMALRKTEDDFWASKQGQKLLRDRVERSFPEFVSRVPAKLLKEVGLKRHYKEPEPVKQLRPGPTS